MQLHPNFDILIETIGELRETMARNTAILEVNTEQLKEHIRRTELLEQSLDHHRDNTARQMEEALLPIKTFKAIAKFFGYVAAIGSGIGALAVIIRIFASKL